MTVPGAVKVIHELMRNHPELVVGAGTLHDLEVARRCIDAGATFLTSPGLDLEIVEFTRKKGVLVFPGCADADRSHDCMEGRLRSRQGLSLRASRRGKLHQSPRGPVSRGAFHRFWRCESEHSHGLCAGWGGCPRHWSRLDPARRDPKA